MNETLWMIVQIVTPILGAMIGWIMYSLNTRITTLEEESDKLQQIKLDKEDYHRDQGALRETLRIVQQDIKELGNAIRDLPEKMVSFLNTAGKI